MDRKNRRQLLLSTDVTVHAFLFHMEYSAWKQGTGKMERQGEPDRKQSVPVMANFK
ncbi:hypothetical protein [Virgibacillus senegalensis]|uniref:hypothetical protein n=1 Tax=Virgibacillus senegalensis TaxID=1499679 RepID=UPI000AC9C922|nr:hypothetical protein [Virgibacillus senegalensis]